MTTAAASAAPSPPQTTRPQTLALGSAQLAPAQRPGRPAVFIDKDGTLVENVPYNADPALLRFKPGAIEALAALARAGLALVVVTNQSGLAHGHFTRAQFAVLQAELQRRLREQAGVELTDFVLCPHAPGSDGRPTCLCRKPAPGMLLRAARLHGLELADCWMVGDTLDDVEAGHRAGCRTVFFDSGGETVWRLSPLREPNASCSDWSQVARLILQELGTNDGTSDGIEGRMNLCTNVSPTLGPNVRANIPGDARAGAANVP